MLSGDNGILQRATDAKERTGETQIKEEIGLAWNGVQAEGIVNNWNINKKVEELQNELKKEDSSATATASGNNVNIKNYKGYDAVINTTNGSFTSFAKSSGDGGGGTGTLVLTATQITTESRAAVIEVSVEAGEAPTEAELHAKSQEELQPMFVAACQQLGAPFTNWNDISNGNSTMTVEDAFINYNMTEMGYSNVYDLIIQTGAYAKPATFTLNGETITGTSAKFVVTKNGSYTISAVQGEESGTTTIGVDKCKIEEYSSIQNSNSTVTQGDYTAVIPAGFAYGTSENVGTVTTGLVITDSVETVNGKNYSNGNEFVWIPVDKENLTVGKTTKKMAEISSGSNYSGVFYDIMSQGDSTREPAYLSDYDNTQNQYAISDDLQIEYNKMIASVKKYGGFYVARYEMGKDNNYSKLNVIPTSASTDDENMWYGLYSKAKNYNKVGVTSQMIWGSQYDAMLNFGLTNSSDSAKVTANTYGNHMGTLLKTGTHKSSDSINNIFDLEGNMSEFTQEACDTVFRVYRGRKFLSSIST